MSNFKGHIFGLSSLATGCSLSSQVRTYSAYSVRVRTGGGRPLLICRNVRGCGQPGSRKMAKCFETVLLGCPVTPTEARKGKVRPNIKFLGRKASDSEHFVMI